MNFEEESPSLKDKFVADDEEYGILFMTSAIEEACLDKQRVREAIIRNSSSEGSSTLEPIGKRIMTELGLND